MFDSDRLKYDMFNVNNGIVTVFRSVQTGSPPEGIIKYEDDIGTIEPHASSGFDVKSLDSRALPSTMTLGVFMGYDSQWDKAFMGQSIPRLNQVFNLVQNIFRWKSLTTKITLKDLGTRKYLANLDINDGAM